MHSSFHTSRAKPLQPMSRCRSTMVSRMDECVSQRVPTRMYAHSMPMYVLHVGVQGESERSSAPDHAGIRMGNSCVSSVPCG